MPIAYKDYQDKITMVNSNLVGLKERNKNNPPADATNGKIFHPATKNDWGTIDRIRGCLGRYKAIYTSAGYANHNVDAKLLINYSSYAQQLKNGAPSNTGANDTEVGRIKKQLLNPVIDYTIQPSTKIQPGPLSSTRSRAKYEFIVVNGHNANWNAWTNSSPESRNYLLQPTQLFATPDQFTPAPGAGTYAGLSRGASIDHPATYGGNILDHTAVFYGPPRNLETREKSGLLFDPSPTYNFYVQTGVSYEGVIASPLVTESLLPNVYYLQHELINTSSTLLAPYHLDAITLAQNIDYFEISNNQTVTEANTRSYYNMYTDGLQDLLFDPPALEEAKGILVQKNKNFAVLHSDLNALDKKAIHLSTVPFYNTIAIGSYQDQVTGYADHRSVLNALWDDKETRDFVDLLQYTAIMHMTNLSANAVSGSFAVTEKRAEASSWKNSSTGDFMPAYDTDSHRETTVLFDLGRLAEDFERFNGQIVTQLHQQLDNQDQWATPFKRIRDYTRENLASDPQATFKAINRLFASSPAGDLANARAVTRPMEKVFKNTSCHSETLLYVIHKRRVSQGSTGPVPGQIVQTFYISPRLHSHMPAYFYDSQVKYNQQYQYDVSKVVLVFGNAYHYESSEYPVYPGVGGPEYPVMQSDIWNETSIKAIVVPHVIGGLAAAPIIDKPPREPEISFYAYKGINDKLLILLNATTGKTVQAPVQILEGDRQYFEEEYYSQNRTYLTFDEIKEQGKKIIFKSDDPVDRYQLFKLRRAPASYGDFINSLLPEIDPDFGVGGTLIDNIKPNTKYYYCARAIDVHENVSNPTRIFEIEMVDNNGQIFLKQNIFSFEKEGENLVKSGRRFIYIEPALQQVVIDRDTLGSRLGNPSVTEAPPTALLGAAGLDDQVWGKGFKVRLTSKQTGRKLDLNINFTNTGKVNPSE